MITEEHKKLFSPSLRPETRPALSTSLSDQKKSGGGVTTTRKYRRQRVLVNRGNITEKFRQSVNNMYLGFSGSSTYRYRILTVVTIQNCKTCLLKRSLPSKFEK